MDFWGLEVKIRGFWTFQKFTKICLRPSAIIMMWSNSVIFVKKLSFIKRFYQMFKSCSVHYSKLNTLIKFVKFDKSVNTIFDISIIAELNFDHFWLILIKLNTPKITNLKSPKVPTTTGHSQVSKKVTFLMNFCHTLYTIFWYFDQFWPPKQTKFGPLSTHLWLRPAI